jgi:PAS domain S-box-containing protein
VKLFEHANHTEELLGVRAEDIHKWIDGFFDLEGFDRVLSSGKTEGFDPYSHRKYRHCIEALEDAYREFEGKYTREQIKGVFETHLRDDYNGYLPVQSDFEEGTFTEKYHETDDHSATDRILGRAELNEYFKGKAYVSKEHRKKKSLNPSFWLGILLPTLAAILLFVASFFGLILPQFKDALLNQKKTLIRELTQTAASVIQPYIQKVERGELNLGDAQKAAATEISTLRYGDENKDYFWITDMHPRMIMHPYRSDLTGADLSKYTDKERRSGKKLFVESVALVSANNEGYLEYFWQWKDDPTRQVPKLSYVLGIPEWQWIIGTGVYVNDVHEEIQNMTQRILITFGFITAGLVGVLIIIVRQSLGIEHDRQKAESGLIEAKERYRALVEASNEAYVLELEGEHVYVNHPFQRWLGYTEAQALSRDIWDRLLPRIEVNITARENLDSIFSGKTIRSEFEARIAKENGDEIDSVIRVSRIFFSEKNGHVIAIRPIFRNKSETIETTKHASLAITSLQDILREIKVSPTEGHVIRILNRLPTLLSDRIKIDSNAGEVRALLAEVYTETAKRYITLAMDELGQSPVPFVFLSFGSAARREMTLFSDQDNAIVFAESEHADTETHRDFFLKLAHRVCEKLDQAGYPFCEGGIMATNPKWCLSVGEWKAKAAQQFQNPTPEALLEINIFADLHPLYGDLSLFNDLQQSIFELAGKSTVFFACYARSCLDYTVPLGVFGQLRTAQLQGTQSLNIKDCIAPIILFARIYSLKQAIPQPATLERLQTLYERGILSEKAFQEMTAVFNYFCRLRLINQIEAHNDLRKIDDLLDIAHLSESERQECRALLSTIPPYQAKISFDFLGVDPSQV